MLVGSPLLASTDDAATKSYNSEQVNVSWRIRRRFTEAKYGRHSINPSRRSGLPNSIKCWSSRPAQCSSPASIWMSRSPTSSWAGQVEPFQGPSANAVRVIKSIYPPDINLGFHAHGRDGQVIDQANANCATPLPYRASASRSDSLPVRETSADGLDQQGIWQALEQCERVMRALPELRVRLAGC